MSAACDLAAQQWPADQQDVAQAVCMAESSGNPGAVGDAGDSIGLFQVDTVYHSQYDKAALADPSYNARAALAIWQGSGWGAWSTYNNGAYRSFLRGNEPSSPGGPAATVQNALTGISGSGLGRGLVLGGLGLGLAYALSAAL